MRPNGCWASEVDGVLVTDQYAGYRFIDSSQRQLCWSPCTAQCGSDVPTAAKGQSISPLGPDWCFSQIAYSGFDMAMNKACWSRETISAEGLSDVGKAGERAGARQFAVQQALPRSLSATAQG